MSVRSILSSLVLVILIAASSAEDIVSGESTTVRTVTDGLRKVEESFVQILGQSRHVLSFARFTHRHGKVYQHAEEIKHRFSVFKENLDFIRSTNKKGLSYKLGVNQFADLTFQEFKRSKTGATQYPFATLKGSRRLTETTVPETKDWRHEGGVSPVKDQGRCGSSWAFSAIGAIESACLMKNASNCILSEQELIDCSVLYGNFGCVSGLPSRAFDYIKSKGLSSTPNQYPYKQVLGLCGRNPGHSRVNVTGYVSITSGDEDELKQAVGSIGPVSISLHVATSFQTYKSGILNGGNCGNALKDMNHFALAVGYGIENGIPYWIIKNSWGSKWGDRGYIKMERGKNLCGVATRAMYPILA